MNGPEWLRRDVLLAAHAQCVVEHGGPPGIRDDGLLDSALARPRNILAYLPDADLCTLAAAYSVGLAKNHPFVDGNKRVAFIAAALFLELNGHVLNAPEGEVVVATVDLAAGTLDEDGFARWLRDRIETPGRSEG